MSCTNASRSLADVDHDATHAPRDEPAERFVYWLPPADFEENRPLLEGRGYTLTPARLTPCQVLKARGRTLIYASPQRWDGFCNRQGSWYRHSHRNGQYMLVSDHELPCSMSVFLDVRISPSDFTPPALPGAAELREVVESPEYRAAKPPGWERLTWFDRVSLKIFFRLKRFWRRGEALKDHWTGQRANHANFLARRFTTRLGEEDVAYSVTGNASVCSSCVQYFNLMTPESRKLVRACPGSITFAKAKRGIYYDVQPVTVSISAHAKSAGSAT